jgi:aryl-alcohol dehydrogenase-like predicted oxidoreductase
MTADEFPVRSQAFAAGALPRHTSCAKLPGTATDAAPTDNHLFPEPAAGVGSPSQYAATPAQIARAWLLHKIQRVLLIPGTSSVTHLEHNMTAARVALDDEDLAALDGVSRP